MVKQGHHGSNLGITFTIAPRVTVTELSLRAGCISNLRSTVVLKKCILTGLNGWHHFVEIATTVGMIEISFTILTTQNGIWP